MRQATFVLASCLALAPACALKPAPEPPRAGLEATTRDGVIRYRVNSEADRVEIIDVQTGATLARVKVGNSPAQIILAPDDTAYVVNRGSRSVSIIRRAEYREDSRLPVGVEPVSLALTADGSTLYVTNSASLDSPERGSLMAIDTARLEVSWELPLATSPRRIELVGPSHARVTTEGRGFLTIDLAEKKVLSASGPALTAASM